MSRFFRFVRTSLSFAAVVAVSSCTKSCSSGRGLPPEKVVEAYLNTSFNLQRIEDRSQLLLYTTGPLKDAIASASDETIRQAYVDRRYHVISYSVVERRDRTPRETEITFQLKYKDLGRVGGEQMTVEEAPQVQTENKVAVIREKGEWLIRDVIGADTKIDFAISKDSEIKPRPAGQRTNPSDVKLEEAQ